MPAKGEAGRKLGTACRRHVQYCLHYGPAESGKIFYCSAESDYGAALAVGYSNMKGSVGCHNNSLPLPTRNSNSARQLPEKKKKTYYFFFANKKHTTTKQFQVSSQVKATVYIYTVKWYLLAFIEIHAI